MKVNKTICVDATEWDFVIKQVGYGNMSEFINQFIVSEAKRRGLMGGYVNVFSPTTKSPEAAPETPEQTWKRIEGAVNYVRSCIAEVKPDNPDYTTEDFPFLYDYAKQCNMSRGEFAKWVDGEYKEIEMKANVLDK